MQNLHLLVTNEVMKEWWFSPIATLQVTNHNLKPAFTEESKTQKSAWMSSGISWEWFPPPQNLFNQLQTSSLAAVPQEEGILP